MTEEESPFMNSQDVRLPSWLRPTVPLHIHFDCFSGAAGDMILASCLDAAGPESDQLLRYIDECIRKGLPELDGEYELSKKQVWRGSGQISATHVTVTSLYDHAPAPVPRKKKIDTTTTSTSSWTQEEKITSTSVDDKSELKMPPKIDHDHNHDHAHNHEHTHNHQSDDPLKQSSSDGSTLNNNNNNHENHSHDEHGIMHNHSPHGGGPLRNWPEIRRMLQEEEELSETPWLPPWVRTKALETFGSLAEAEAAVHGAASPNEVYFHEVGAVDSIVDVVGSLLALHRLGATSFSCSPLPMSSSGFIHTQYHGWLPLPAPATLHLLMGMETCAGPPAPPSEWITPTGAALLRVLTDAKTSRGVPPLRLIQYGHGAGTRDFPHHPNILRILIGERLNG